MRNKPKMIKKATSKKIKNTVMKDNPILTNSFNKETNVLFLLITNSYQLFDRSKLWSSIITIAII